MKKLLSILLVAAMLMSFTVCAFAEEPADSQPYEAPFEVTPASPSGLPEQAAESLQGAVDAAQSGGTIEVNRSNETGGAVIDGSKVDGEVVIDLNNNTLTINRDPVGSTGYESQGMQLKKGDNDNDGVVIKDGTLVIDSKDDTVNLKVGINNYTDLTLNNVTVDGTKLNNEIENYVVSNNNGSLTVTEGASIIAAEGDVAFDVYLYTDGGYVDGPTVVITNTAGTIDGVIEFDGSKTCAESVPRNDENSPKLSIEGGTFENFVLRIGEAVADFVEDCIKISGGSFDSKNVESSEGYVFEDFLVEDHVVVEQDGRFVVMTKAAAEALNKQDDIVAVIPADTYVPPVYEAPAGNATVEVNGESVTVQLDSTVVSATAAPVALADETPVVVKVNVSHTALSANVFTAIDMVEALSQTLEVKDADGAVIDAEQYEVVFDGHGQIQIKLSAELMQKLGAGSHVLTINLGGYEIEVTIVIQ